MSKSAQAGLVEGCKWSSKGGEEDSEFGWWDGFESGPTIDDVACEESGSKVAPFGELGCEVAWVGDADGDDVAGDVACWGGGG